MLNDWVNKVKIDDIVPYAIAKKYIDVMLARGELTVIIPYRQRLIGRATTAMFKLQKSNSGRLPEQYWLIRCN